MSEVAITKCQSYDLGAIGKALREIVSNSSFPDCEGKTILVKPNILSDARPEEGITTHPLVVEAVINLLKEKGAKKIYCGDSPGLQGPSFKGRNCGIYDVCMRTGAEWCDFTLSPNRKRIGGHWLPICSALDGIDFSISVCKAKTHQLMYMTGAVKNCFGLIPSLGKSPCHVKAPSREAFASLLCAIFEEAKCAYAISDAIIGMEGAGPANGTLRNIGLLLGSDNAFDLDASLSVIMGYSPESIPVLKRGKELGKTDLEPMYTLLDAKGLVIPDFKRIDIEKSKGFFKSLVLPFLFRPFERMKAKRRPTPKFLSEKCILCLRCVEICPAKALAKKDGRIALDASLCVRCYCCHEMCPKGAIEITAN